MERRKKTTDQLIEHRTSGSLATPNTPRDNLTEAYRAFLKKPTLPRWFALSDAAIDYALADLEQNYGVKLSRDMFGQKEEDNTEESEN